MKILFSVLLCLGGCWFGSGTVAMAGDGTATNVAPVRVGVFDSRAVACAWFGTADHQRRLNEQAKAARAAKSAGDTEQAKKLDRILVEEQAEIHRQVFSTAPAAGALAVIKERIPEIEKQAGVAVLISKWDEPALKQYPEAEKVDVTDQLVREFKPTEKQLKVIADLQKKKPLSLEKCNELIRKGQI